MSESRLWHVLHWIIKKILGERQTTPLNSTTRLRKWQKRIQKHTRNTMVPVYIVSVVSLKNSGWTPIGSMIEKEKYYGSIANPRYLIWYVIIKVDIERIFGKVQGIQRYLFYLFLSCIRILAHKPMIGSEKEKEKYYASIANHQHLIRYVIKVDIQRRFRKVQGIQRYQFYLFLSCIRILAHEPTIRIHNRKRKSIMHL